MNSIRLPRGSLRLGATDPSRMKLESNPLAPHEHTLTHAHTLSNLILTQDTVTFEHLGPLSSSESGCGPLRSTGPLSLLPSHLHSSLRLHQP